MTVSSILRKEALLEKEGGGSIAVVGLTNSIAEGSPDGEG